MHLWSRAMSLSGECTVVQKKKLKTLGLLFAPFVIFCRELVSRKKLKVRYKNLENYKVVIIYVILSGFIGHPPAQDTSQDGQYDSCVHEMYYSVVEHRTKSSVGNARSEHFDPPK